MHKRMQQHIKDVDLGKLITLYLNKLNLSTEWDEQFARKKKEGLFSSKKSAF